MKLLPFIASLSALSMPLSTALAQEYQSPPSDAAITQEVATPSAQEPQLSPLTDNAVLDAGIRALQHEWARIKYQVAEGQQEAEMALLVPKAAKLSAEFGGYAEPKIWHAIILSSQAGFNGGLDSLDLVREAKNLLEAAEKINANALDGSIYTALGSLYYKVPGWPVSFGDNDKALAYLEQARAVNPDGIDPNYFYGDYLIEQGKYAEAIPVLEHALKAAPRPGREDADAGRRTEVMEALSLAKSKASK